MLAIEMRKEKVELNKPRYVVYKIIYNYIFQPDLF